jgi:hypothetical protein
MATTRIKPLILSLLMAAAGVLPSFGGPNGVVTVRPKDNGSIPVNPGMGWVFHHYDNSIRNYGVDLEPWDTVDEFPGVGVIYLRLAWSYLEPEEGKFNWSYLDIPTQRWVAKGKQIALRLTCSESGAGVGTPDWVRKAGAKVYYYDQSRKITERGPRWEPDFDDPIFLEKLDRFLAAVAARYDGDRNLAFVDVGTFGVWGEGHTLATTLLPYNARTVRTHIDLHTKHFKRTLLVFNDDTVFQGRGVRTLTYAHDQGLTLRDDSVLVRGGEEAYFSHVFAGQFWPRLPVVLESEHYAGSVRRGNWGDGSAYLRAVEDTHASYVSVHGRPRDFLKGTLASGLVERISLRMGYRLQLVEASFPETATAGGKLTIAYRWKNGGVAPCLPGGFTTFTLKGTKAGIAGVFVDEGFNVRTLPVGPPGRVDDVGREATFALPLASILKPGTYELFVSVGSQIGTPAIELPLADGDGYRRYRLGTIKIVDEARPATVPTS